MIIFGVKMADGTITSVNKDAAKNIGHLVISILIYKILPNCCTQGSTGLLPPLIEIKMTAYRSSNMSPSPFDENIKYF